MNTIILALLPVIGWGTWFAIAQNIRSPNPRAKNFYISLSNLFISIALFLTLGKHLDLASFLPVFLGGVLWSLAGVFGFASSGRIGLAQGGGIWVPVNLVVGLVWGMVIFGELDGATPKTLSLTAISVAILFGGILLILAAQRDGKSSAVQNGGKERIIGIVFAIFAGLCWGSYFIPIRASGISAWSAALPMSLGMVVGSLVLGLLYPAPIVLERPKDYFVCAASGLLWSAGNYGMLILAERIGTGRGFAVAQLNIIVNATIGIYYFKNPKPGTKTANMALAGCVVTAVGGVLLGMSK
jgi:glucose uptake protein